MSAISKHAAGGDARRSQRKRKVTNKFTLTTLGGANEKYGLNSVLLDAAFAQSYESTGAQSYETGVKIIKKRVKKRAKKNLSTSADGRADERKSAKSAKSANANVCASCGRVGHRRKSNFNCPLNPNYKKVTQKKRNSAESSSESSSESSTDSSSEDSESSYTRDDEGVDSEFSDSASASSSSPAPSSSSSSSSSSFPPRRNLSSYVSSAANSMKDRFIIAAKNMQSDNSDEMKRIIYETVKASFVFRISEKDLICNTKRLVTIYTNMVRGIRSSCNLPPLTDTLSEIRRVVSAWYLSDCMAAGELKIAYDEYASNIAKKMFDSCTDRPNDIKIIYDLASNMCNINNQEFVWQVNIQTGPIDEFAVGETLCSMLHQYPDNTYSKQFIATCHKKIIYYFFEAFAEEHTNKKFIK